MGRSKPVTRSPASIHNNPTKQQQYINNNNSSSTIGMTEINNDISNVPFAPIYRPTAEEFRNPLQYIASIRNEAYKFGICKIIPPDNYKPTVEFNWFKHKFETKLQYINELQTRNGDRNNSYSYDNVDQNEIYNTDDTISETSNNNDSVGFDDTDVHVVSVDSNNNSTTATNAFNSNSGNISIQSTNNDNGSDNDTTTPNKKQRYDPTTPHTNIDTTNLISNKKRSRKSVNKFEVDDNNSIYSNDKSSLQKNKDKSTTSSSKKKKLTETTSITESYINDYSTTVCEVCGGGSHDNKMLLCDECDRGVHIWCLTRPLDKIPEGDWYWYAYYNTLYTS